MNKPMLGFWILLVALLAEVATVATLFAAVYLFGPSDAAQAPQYAQRLGYTLGPLAGAVFTFAGAWWLARGLGSGRRLVGAAVGLSSAWFDLGLLVISGATLQPVFVISSVVRIMAGALGGLTAEVTSAAK